MSESKRGALTMEGDTWSPRDRRNQLRVAGLCLVWALSFVGAMWLIKRELVPAGPLAWLAAAVPSVIAVWLIYAFLRFVREADELQRLIQLQALGLGFAGGFFAICGNALLDASGAPALDPVDVAVVMPLLYALGSVLGWRRYR